MKWLDWFSLVADVVTIIGIPSLWYAYHQLWKQHREARRIKIVSENCLEFLVPGRAINLVRLDGLPVLPRMGDMVYLPAEDGGEFDRGSYRVQKLEYFFVRPAEEHCTQPAEAVLGKVVANVERVP